MTDAFDLQRFLHAQEPVISQVVHELTAGRKTSHWMWFVFPQMQGLGSSPTAKRYAIGSRAEAEAYLRHDRLGPRLRQCTGLVNRIEGKTVAAIFGSPDDMKFRSCMTLFSALLPPEPVFAAALARYFEGKPDPLTLVRLSV